MDVITMASTSSLINHLKADYPHLAFKQSDTFSWSPITHTVFYPKKWHDNCASLLHELSHALLGHETFDHDVQLLQMERDAWQYAKNNLAKKYQISVTDDDIESALDSYRAWLYVRSTCPDCDATGILTKNGTYTCIACGCHWRANDARTCNLRRVKLKS